MRIRVWWSKMSDKMALAQQQNIELLRCLYHLDLFRRSIRKVNNASYLNSVKQLFNHLTLIMSDYSENNINPVVINNMINNHLTEVCWSTLRDDAIYERICRELYDDREDLEINNHQIQPLLQYNLTKVCTTCGSGTPMNGCEKNQYIISIEPIETVTFEEQIIASLDSNEFCEMSNCFGHQRTYRCLTRQPNIYTFDYRQTMTKLFQLHEFFTPSLIFKSQHDHLYKVTAITLNPASSLVYHSRLNIWLFINNNTIKPLCSNFNNLKYNFSNYSIQLVFYTLENIQNNVIYANWQTTTMGNINVINPAVVPIPTPIVIIPPNQIVNPPSSLQLQQLKLQQQTHQDLLLETETEYYDSGISSYNSSIETTSSHQENHMQQFTPPPEMNHQKTVNSCLTNYATIKRNRSKCKNILKSISVPNLSIPIEAGVKRKVSFNCDIELIDLNEEYNPHPILMKILEKMKI